MVQEGNSVQLVTVFAGDPDRVAPPSLWDRPRSTESAAEVVAQRRDDDRRATSRSASSRCGCRSTTMLTSCVVIPTRSGRPWHRPSATQTKCSFRVGRCPPGSSLHDAPDAEPMQRILADPFLLRTPLRTPSHHSVERSASSPLRCIPDGLDGQQRCLVQVPPQSQRPRADEPLCRVLRRRGLGARLAHPAQSTATPPTRPRTHRTSMSLIPSSTPIIAQRPGQPTTRKGA